MWLWLLALLVMVPTVGWAGTASMGCGFTGTAAGTAGTAVGAQAASKHLGGTDRWCYRFVVGDGAHNVGPLHITETAATVWFDPDLYAATTSTARVIVHFCPQGEAVTAGSPFNSCPSTGGANSGTTSLDGTEGADGDHNQAKRYASGTLYFEVSAACAAGDTCQICVVSEGAK